MTAHDVRTAAPMFRFSAEQWREYQSIPDQGYSHRHWIEHQVNEWAALVTPTRRQAILAAQDALGCDIDWLEGFMPGCQEHEADITEEGLCPNATAAADSVLALVGAVT